MIFNRKLKARVTDLEGTLAKKARVPRPFKEGDVLVVKRYFSYGESLSLVRVTSVVSAEGFFQKEYFYTVKHVSGDTLNTNIFSQEDLEECGKLVERL